jgi:hypothetical protein
MIRSSTSSTDGASRRFVSMEPSRIRLHLFAVQGQPARSSRCIQPAVACCMPTTRSTCEGADSDACRWAANDSCLFCGDGVSPWVVRHHLKSRRSDTIRLPAHRVPPFDAERGRDARRLAEALGVPPPPPRASDAPLWHWSGLVLDPDGHVWVRPWTASLQHSGVAYRIVQPVKCTVRG